MECYMTVVLNIFSMWWRQSKTASPTNTSQHKNAFIQNNDLYDIFNISFLQLIILGPEMGTTMKSMVAHPQGWEPLQYDM